MTGDLTRRVTGLDDPGTPQRPDAAWLAESIGFLALVATRDTYAADPGLWDLGEHGRARTLEDFTHHLRAALGSQAQWRDHLDYCVRLFDARGFPQRWLTEAFATLSAVLGEVFGPAVGTAVRARFDGAGALLAEVAGAAGIDLHRVTRYDAPDVS